MAVRIEADFLLGTYQGHRSDGSSDDLPDPARLHAALVAVAGAGPRAVAQSGELILNPNDESALRWLENNPPTRIHWPPHRKVASGYRIAYRHEGVVVKEVGTIKDKVVGRNHSDATALAGPVIWEWPSMPAVVRESLGHLCPEVPCLGETTSPVRLSIEVIRDDPAANPSARVWILDPDPASLSTSAIDVRVPHVGRTSALIEAHATSRKGPPRPNQDGHAWTAYPAPSPVSAVGLRLAAYVPDLPPEPDLPWARAVLIPVSEPSGQEVPEHRRVAFAVSVHRALIARIGTGAVPAITGAYDEGTRRPPNRVGIQYLTRSMTALMSLPDGCRPEPMIALLIPTGCDPAAGRQIAGALRGWSYVRHFGVDHALQVDTMMAVPADRFWRPPVVGTIRRWVTATPAVPETRPQARTGAQSWTLADAAAVSAGLLWRDVLAGDGLRGPELFGHLRNAAEGLGFRVRDLVPVTGRPARDYVHATPNGLVIQPYRAVLDLGRLASDRSVVAIGQSRHLGGGLLLPFDIPEAVAASDWGAPRW